MKNFIHKHRKLQKLSIEELATYMKISLPELLLFEENKEMPDAIIALKLGKFLKTKVQNLFVLEESDNNYKENFE